MRRDVQDKGEFIWITLPNTKTKITREFAITDGNIQGISCLDLFRKYMDLRPSQTKHDRFFLIYRGGKMYPAACWSEYNRRNSKENRYCIRII
jgi:hypothetical protein